jgi:hypothetical protein
MVESKGKKKNTENTVQKSTGMQMERSIVERNKMERRVEKLN